MYFCLVSLHKNKNMSEVKTKISNERIENFLQGSDPEKYIVAIEAGYSEPNVTLVVNDPEKGKYSYEHPYKPFLWFKQDILDILYDGGRKRQLDECSKYGIKLKQLRTSDSIGNVPARLQNGYKYMATCTKSYNNLVQFFKNGGVDIFNKEFSIKIFFY